MRSVELHDRAARLVGIITESNLLDVLLEMIGVDEKGMRITLDLAASSEVADPVRSLVDAATRNGARVTNVLTFCHPDPETGVLRRLGVVRLLGRETPTLLDELAAVGQRVRRVTRVA